MRKLSFLFAAVVMLSLSLSSCKKDDLQADAVSTTLKTGTWKISNYNDSGTDQTNDFTGHTFIFSADGSAWAISGSDSTAGTWSTVDSDDDNTAHLNLNFGTLSPLDELEGDWHVTEQSATVIALEDVSGGNGGIDLLTFTQE
jgi:hypothetical protein